MEIILIAAMAANRVIGRNNTIPWHLPGEQKRFKEITWGNPIIMGRKTHESIGKPLPGRRNIIVTRNPNYSAEGCEIALSLDQAYELCRDEERVFNIGGAQLYQLGIRDAHTLLLTVLPAEIAGDTYFPEFSEHEFRLCSTETVAQPVSYSILTYRRTPDTRVVKNPA